MRNAGLLVLSLALPAAAEEKPAADRFELARHAFESVQETAFEPGAHGRVYPALEALLETRDVRALAPVAAMLSGVLRIDAQFQTLHRTVQKRGAAVRDRADGVEKELNLLREREKAGATDVGPRIQALQEEGAQLAIAFRQVEQEVADLGRRGEYLVELRERLARGCVELLAGTKEAEAGPAILVLRQALDLSAREESLYLVRILRESRAAAAAPHLREIFEHPQVFPAAAAAAVAAAAPIADRPTLEALLAVWKRDPEGLGRHVQLALSLLAKRWLESPAQGDAWLKDPASVTGGKD
ncbi:MAG: hypothetical protein ACT4PV_09895 [Planctomycetaceae bacterium]